MAVGVILDSGGVLLRPKGGDWFPPPVFKEVMLERRLAWDDRRLEAALALAGQYLDDLHSTPLADETAERPIWVGYHRMVLNELGFTAESAELAEAITAAWEAKISVELYPWTVPVLTELRRRRARVVVLSDAWPSLRRWFTELGLDHLVDAMVISGEEGITKPDSRVFAKARGLLGPDLETVVFVDDFPGHVRASVDRACAACGSGTATPRLTIRWRKSPT